MDGQIGQDNVSQVLTMTTDSVGQIVENQGSIEVHYGNGIIKFPSKVTFDDVPWTLNCFCEPNVLEYLRQWRRLVYNPDTEEMGLPSQYMKQVYFIKYDGQGKARDVIKAPGTWISGLQNGEMNQSGGSMVQVQTTFVISRAMYLNPSEF